MNYSCDYANISEPTSYCDDERYDEEDEANASMNEVNGKAFVYPSYDECEDMM